jgi:hypothetical protein
MTLILCSSLPTTTSLNISIFINDKGQNFIIWQVLDNLDRPSSLAAASAGAAQPNTDGKVKLLRTKTFSRMGDAVAQCLSERK